MLQDPLRAGPELSEPVARVVTPRAVSETVRSGTVSLTALAPAEGAAPPFAPEERRRLRLESAATNVFRNLSGSSVVIPVLLGLGATPFQLGLLGASPFLARTAQLVIAARLAKRSARSVALVAGTLERLLFAAVAAVPFWLQGRAGAAGVALCGILLAHLCAESFNAAGTTWHVARVPGSELGRFNAARSSWGQAASFGALLAVACALSALPGSGDARADWLSAAMLLGCAIGIGGILLLRRVPALPDPISMREPIPALESVRSVLRDRAFRSLLGYSLAFGFATHLASPFLLAYAVQGLGFTPRDTVLLAATGLGTGALMLPLWGRITDRFGNRPVLVGCGAWAGLVPLLWVAFAREATPYAVFPIEILSGTAWAGINLAAGNALTKIAPRDHRRLVYVGTFTALTGALVGVAPLLGGALLAGLTPLVGTTAAYKLVFTVSGGLRLLALFRLRRVVERRSRTLAHSARALGRSGAPWGSPVFLAALLFRVPAAAEHLRRRALQRSTRRLLDRQWLRTRAARAPAAEAIEPARSPFPAQ